MEDVPLAQVFWVSFAAFSLTLIQFFETFYKRDDWPFSCYKMFAGRRRNQRKVLHLYGVTRDGSEERELLLVDPKHLFPFDRIRLSYAFKALMQDKGPGPQIVEGLKDCYERYEIRRQRGLHSGPCLEEVRLYWVEWEILPFAGNRYSPEKRERVASWALRAVSA